MKKEISFESLNELEEKYYTLIQTAEEMRRRENDVRDILKVIRERMEADENARAQRIEELTRQAADPSASATVRAIAMNAAGIAGADRATVTNDEKKRLKRQWRNWIQHSTQPRKWTRKSGICWTTR